MGYLSSAGGQKLLIDGIGGLVMGVGYTTGAYTGYGASNTLDPLGIHAQAKSYNKPQYIKIDSGMSYGYRRRFYRRSFRRYRKRRSYYPRYYHYTRRYY